MADIVSREKRSQMMAGIKGKDTRPELLIRSLLHKRGFRFRLHYSKLPGKPDLVFTKYKAVVFVNGCFFHGHSCHLFKLPSTNTEFWIKKITANQERDAKHITMINHEGWKVMTIWECAVKGKNKIPLEELTATIASWLTSGATTLEITGR